MVKAQSYPTSQSRFLGGITAVVGPNGSGKSTVLRALARLLSPTQRAIYLNGDNIAQLSTRAIARQLAILPPIAPNPGKRTVWELISYGRYPHQGLLKGISKADRGEMEWAIEMTGWESLAERAVDTLSGGERQRA